MRFFTTGAFFGPLGSRPACRVPALYSRMTFDTLACLPALVVGFFIRLFHRLTALALPFFTRKSIWAIRIRLPIAFYLGTTSAVRIAFGCAGSDSITTVLRSSSLSVLNGTSTTSLWVLNDLCKTLFHVIYKRMFCLRSSWAGPQTACQHDCL